MATRLLKRPTGFTPDTRPYNKILRRKYSMTKRLLVLLAVMVVAVGAYAQAELNDGNPNSHKFFVRGYQKVSNSARPGSGLVDHGGPVMVSPSVVCIFWGFGTGNSYTAAMQSFR